MDRKRFQSAVSNTQSDQSEASRHERFQLLLTRHGIDTAMISIPKVARVLGYAPATLYGYIKAGSFFLPYRVVQGSPMVAADDFLDWCSSRKCEVFPQALAKKQEEESEVDLPETSGRRSVDERREDAEKIRAKMEARASARMSPAA